MKKIIFIIICIFIAFSFASCSNEIADKTEITINLPTDDTVNGYRIESDSNKISADEVTVAVDTNEVKYCGNKNTKKFHRITCSSVTTIQNDNKIYYKTKDEFLNNGYTACKKCNP